MVQQEENSCNTKQNKKKTNFNKRKLLFSRRFPKIYDHAKVH